MWYSEKCRTKLTAYWNRTLKRCVPCEVDLKKRAGYEFAPNCGRQDDGGQPAPAYEPCEKGTFNNGSFVACRKCMSCPPGQQTLAQCNTTIDTQCCEKTKTCTVYTAIGSPKTSLILRIFWEMVIHGKCQTPETMMFTSTSAIPAVSTLKSISTGAEHQPSGPISHNAWIAAVVLLFLVGLLLLIFKSKKMKCFRKGNPTKVKKNMDLLRPRKDPKMDTGAVFVNINADSQLPHKNQKVDELLALHIQEAPLRTVLDNLDILEELIMLLDPDSSVAKTTRHVATHCSFSATWINYAYSMRDSRSPLKAVLEAVSTKFPEWTVGHLARVFNDIGRNDAVAVLAKLPMLKPSYKNDLN